MASVTLETWGWGPNTHASWPTDRKQHHTERLDEEAHGGRGRLKHFGSKHELFRLSSVAGLKTPATLGSAGVAEQLPERCRTLVLGTFGGSALGGHYGTISLHKYNIL